MDLINKKVIHKIFGEGIIAEAEDTYIKVKFDSEKTLKKFTYPAAFETHLSFADKYDEEQSKIDLKNHNDEEAEKTRYKNECITETNAKLLTMESKEKVWMFHEEEKDISVIRYSIFDTFINAFKSNVRSEADYLKATGGKRYQLFYGKFLVKENGKFIYVFESEEDINLPPGTTIECHIAKSVVHGTVLWCEDYYIAIVVSLSLGEEVLEMEITAEPWKLLYALHERLEELRQNQTPITNDLACHGIDNIEKDNHNISKGQHKAFEMAMTQPITFIWGPPGTGKTHTLSEIAIEHIKRGYRVLMVSYSNVSVDGAILKVFDRNPSVELGVIVRYGYPKSDKLLNHEYLTSYNLALRNNPKLAREKEELYELIKKLDKKSIEYTNAYRRLSAVKDMLSKAEKEIIHKARFVATTVAEITVEKEFYDYMYDVVIFDEASMAYIPQVIQAAGLAKKHFICLGDFRQLPPIVQKSNTSQLNCDIFQYCGITDAVNQNVNHKWLCMLDTQYRMHPDIANLVSDTMYSGYLKSHESVLERCEKISGDEVFPGTVMGLVDLSGMMSVCTRTKKDSKVNLLSALTSFKLALISAKKNDVAIITPYNAQSNLLRAMSRDLESSGEKLHNITCATVHSFQGSEKDIVIYDSVDCYRSARPGVMITRIGNNYANRLFNVAVTRAKGKFITVANTEYIKNKNISKKLFFRNIIDFKENTEDHFKAEYVNESMMKDNNLTMQNYKSIEAAIAKFQNDIRSAKKEIRMDIPSPMKLTRFSAEVLPALLMEMYHKGVKVFIRAEDKSLIPENLRKISVNNSNAMNPVVIIDNKLTWFGMPESEASFLADGRRIETTARPVIRFQGENTAKAVYHMLEMDYVVDNGKATDTADAPETFASYVLKHKKCSVCGRPMELKRNSKGIYFLGCTGYPSCRKTQTITFDMVDNYLNQDINRRRCKICRMPIEVHEGRYGIYLQCVDNRRHRFNITEI